MHDCEDYADLIIVYGNSKTFRCAECKKEWEETEDDDEQKMIGNRIRQ